MKLIYTPQSRKDLKEIKSYIAANLQNPSAAKNISDKILAACHNLKFYPNMGISLKAKAGIETDYRCLICGNYIAFYTIDSQTVRIERILDGRTEYMKIIF
ncbi:MAG: type II toxin-antitoxin system RelE/ParE family toxin [Faecalibacterium sp.]|nr:type II toxin-antitoxin system RelE/ParE family toxin [Ruminococcus sp.]MCM1392546.1 type II toxin-antitoxin system RelE/ParE family toxin [Ruminococcus sp.]MCM1486252.1 type II toxin-antitoxin system RelE/ParE family toxin [Faecalibacterium sp.]